MSDDDLARKFHGLVDPVLGAARATRLRELCEKIGTTTDLSALFELARLGGAP
jgi:hypothetical protein